MTNRISAPFVNSRQAAAFLGVSSGTLANWRVHRKNLRFYKIGGGVRYRLKDLVEWALANSRQVEQPRPTNTDADDPSLKVENSHSMRTHDA